MKTIKDLFEVYRPKSPDEQRFVDKHVTIKHPDRNGNEDDVFKASNIKTIERKKDRKGYDAGDDEKVYEEVEDLDENAKIVAHLQKRYGDNIRKSHVMSAAKDFGVDASKLTKAVRTKLGKTMLDEEDSEEPPFAGPYDKPGARKDRFGNLVKNKNVPKFLAHKAMRDLEKKKTNEEVEEEEIAALLDEALDLLERTLTPAELKKREEIAQAMERENPGMPMSKKMAIATAQAKKVAEEVEQIDEVKNMTTDKLKSLVARGDSDSEGMSPAFGMQIKAARNELARRKKMGMKEEVEEIDEGIMHNRYERNHGKKARGTGSWAFTTKLYGSPKENEMHFISGQKTLKDAHAEAAKKLGTKHLYVMEEVEQIDEIGDTERGRKVLGSYTSKAARSAAGLMAGAAASGVSGTPSGHGREMGKQALRRLKGIDKAVKRLTKEDVVNKVIENYLPTDYVAPSQEEVFAEQISHLPEAHADLLIALFTELDESNRSVMIETAASSEGINSLIDFALTNRGE